MTKKFTKLKIIKDTGIRKSGRHRILSIRCRCGNIFERQARRLTERSCCNQCGRKGMSRFIFWPTKKLQIVIDNNGTTDCGRDLEQYLEEIKEIYYERQDRKFQEKLELIA